MYLSDIYTVSAISPEYRQSTCRAVWTAADFPSVSRSWGSSLMSPRSCGLLRLLSQQNNNRKNPYL